MKLNIAGARAEGYSDEEIVDFLSKQPGLNIAGAIKEGYSPSEIIDFLGAQNAKQREAVPEMSAKSVAQDALSGALQIGPTVVKGVADLARLATGDRVGKDTSDAMETGIKSIQDEIGSDRAAAQRRNFERDMQDDSVGVWDTLANNKGALADQILPTIGSMFLPVGVAGAAGKVASASVTGLTRVEAAAKIAQVQKVAGIGTVAAQNAADTFTELLDKGVPMQDAYVSAGITVPFSVVAGVLTGGGAEQALTRAITSRTAAATGAKELGKAAGKEGAQEMGEELGQIAGEAYGTGEAPTLQSAGKRMAVAGTLGAVMGGGVNVGEQASAFAENSVSGQLRQLDQDINNAEWNQDQIDGLARSSLSPDNGMRQVSDPEIILSTMAGAPDVDTAVATAMELANAPVAMPEVPAAQPLPVDPNTIQPDLLNTGAQALDQDLLQLEQTASAGPDLSSLTLTDRPSGTLEVSGPNARELVTQLVPGESVQQRKDGSVIVGLKWADTVRQAAGTIPGAVSPQNVTFGGLNAGQQTQVGLAQSTNRPGEYGTGTEETKDARVAPLEKYFRVGFRTHTADQIPARAGESAEVTATRRQEAALVEKLFGKAGTEVVFVSTEDGTERFGGLYFDTKPGRVFVDVGNQGSMQAAIRTRAAHEALHDLEVRDPELFNKIALAIRRAGGAKLNAAKFQPFYDPSGEVQLTGDAQATSEQLANLFGTILHEPKDLQELFDRINEGDPGLVAKMVRAIRDAIDNISAYLDELGGAYNTSAYQGDMKKIRKILMDGYTEFARKQGTNPMQAEVDLAREPKQSPKNTRVRYTVQQLADAAKSQESWKTWYARHEETLLQQFGEDADLFQKILSATSQATGVKGNVTLALKAYEQLHNDEPFTGYLPAVIKNLERIRNDEKLSGRKISQYGEANEGNTDAIAVDRHIAMLFFDTKSPTAGQVESAKARIRNVAKKLGWEPRQVQAALWAYNQVRLGADPEKVESYDKILEARSEYVQTLRAKLGRGEAGGVRSDGAAGQGSARAEGQAKYSPAAKPDEQIDPDKVPVFRFEDHIGRVIFPTIADRTKAGGSFDGVDGATVEGGDPLQGGPGFPFLSRNFDKNIVWATQGKAVVSAKKNKISKHGRPLMAVTLGDVEMHSSNATAVMSYMKTLEAYVRDGRISQENLDALTANIRGLKLSKEYLKEELKAFPGFGDQAALHKFINESSFEARAGIVKEMGKPRSEKLGVPPADKLIRKLLDPELAGNRHLDTVLILEPHDDENTVTLGEDGTDRHLSYKYGVKGRVVGKLSNPVNARELWGEWFASKEQEKLAQKQLYQDIYTGKKDFSAIRDSVDREYYRTKGLYEQEVKSREDQYEKLTSNESKIKKLIAGDFDINLDRSFQMSMPIVEITPELAAKMDSLGDRKTPNTATTQTAVDMVQGNWKISDKSVKEGGVGPADFARELRLNDASGTLTLYTEDELTDAVRGWKWDKTTDPKTGKERKVKVPVDKMRLFQLGDNRIQFALKYGPPDTYGQTIEGLSDNEVTLVSVANNANGVKGIAGPAIMTKAIEEGATFLDCYEVKTNRFDRGFLPTLYSEYGFEVVGRVPFDPEYLTEDHKYAWKQHGWTEADAYPDIVLMKWKGDENDRAGFVRRYIEQGAESLRGTAAKLRARSAARADAVQHAGSGAGLREGQAADGRSDRGDQAAGDRGTLASRAHGIIQQVLGLDEDQKRNLGVKFSPRSGASDEGRSGSVREGGYGTGQPGSVSLTGVHFSQEERTSLAGHFYGQGMKGGEGQRLNRESASKEQRRRIHYYVDEGKGVKPESGVGPHAHVTNLNNLYDLNTDPLNLWDEAKDGITDPADRFNKMEQLVMERGFDGAYVPKAQGTQGVAVLLGKKHTAVPVKYMGTEYRGGAVNKVKEPDTTRGDVVRNARNLPAGQLSGAEWKRLIPLILPGADVSMLTDTQIYYKDAVAKAMDTPADIDFEGIVASMKAAGVLKVECS